MRTERASALGISNNPMSLHAPQHWAADSLLQFDRGAPAKWIVELSRQAPDRQTGGFGRFAGPLSDLSSPCSASWIMPHSSPVCDGSWYSARIELLGHLRQGGLLSHLQFLRSHPIPLLPALSRNPKTAYPPAPTRATSRLHILTPTRPLTPSPACRAYCARKQTHNNHPRHATPKRLTHRCA